MTRDIALVFGVLLSAIILFSSEKLRVDVVAVLIMVALPWMGLLNTKEAFSGMASQAARSSHSQKSS